MASAHAGTSGALHAGKGKIMEKQAFGVVGLGVMGANLAHNIERNGFSVAAFDRSEEKTREFIQKSAGKRIKAASSLAELVAMLEKPRRILLMVPAGAPVDAVLAEIKGFLEAGDIVIDGGNSLYSDTERRVKQLEAEGRGIKFFGMGVSGGEEGALWGPSLMPGGDRESYQRLKPVLEKIAAKAPSDGVPCVTYCGSGGAGHFVKMVHNGIEYGDMQLIAETYALLRSGLGLNASEISKTFAAWNRDVLNSYLIEITAQILKVLDEESGEPLVDRILDVAEQKGTGKWTSQEAL
ncbi:MAG: NADP-dependent phosphogluconate dehydrogenase, partial [Phycisphaerales bacterium]|nr:NADP-dependent phosphogluconate dehydrogenase [Phycisphaerales bacterium]